jgi:hypothetical protein
MSAEPQAIRVYPAPAAFLRPARKPHTEDCMAGRKLKFVYLTLTSAALALAACDSSSLGDITSGPQAAAVVTLQLTDSPGEL